jgi:hypothetical protein
MEKKEKYIQMVASRLSIHEFHTCITENNPCYAGNLGCKKGM